MSANYQQHQADTAAKKRKKKNQKKRKKGGVFKGDKPPLSPPSSPLPQSPPGLSFNFLCISIFSPLRAWMWATRREIVKFSADCHCLRPT